MIAPRRVALLLVLGAWVPAQPACDLSPRVLSVSVSPGVTDTTLSLKVGQEARVGTLLRLDFLGVTSDSRCPTDVMCVWAGNAAVRIGVALGMGPTLLHVLNTTLDPRYVDVGGYRLTLVDLRPLPVSTSRIPPEAYVATFRLQRTGYAPD